MLHRVVWWVLTEVSEEISASIIMVVRIITPLMEAVSFSKLSINNIYKTTQCNTLED